MQHEACRIVFASEVLSTQPNTRPSSWLRDLIMSNDQIADEAKFGPLRLQNECRFSTLQINGRDNIFELCPLEAQLWTFIKSKEATAVVVTDESLQEEASKIVNYMEQISKTPSDVFANWLIKLIYASTEWLQLFKARTCFSQSGPAIDLGSKEHGLELAYPSAPIERPLPLRMEAAPSASQSTLPNVHIDPATYHLSRGLNTPQDQANLFPPARSRMFINSANFFAWLVRDLARWTAATMSPNNPNCHIPTDEELQHQARCIVYDEYVLQLMNMMKAKLTSHSDDPWNQTAADNAQWLQQFKRDVGILSESSDLNNAELDGIYKLYI